MSHIRRDGSIILLFYILQMVLPTTLKKRHSLKTLSVIPAIRRLKDDQAVGAIKEFARVMLVGYCALYRFIHDPSLMCCILS